MQGTLFCPKRSFSMITGNSQDISVTPAPDLGYNF